MIPARHVVCGNHATLVDVLIISWFDALDQNRVIFSGKKKNGTKNKGVSELVLPIRV